MKYFLSVNNITIFRQRDNGEISVCAGKDIWFFTGMDEVHTKCMKEITEAEVNKLLMARELLK